MKGLEGAFDFRLLKRCIRLIKNFQEYFFTLPTSTEIHCPSKRCSGGVLSEEIPLGNPPNRIILRKMNRSRVYSLWRISNCIESALSIPSGFLIFYLGETAGMETVF